MANDQKVKGPAQPAAQPTQDQPPAQPAPTQSNDGAGTTALANERDAALRRAEEAAGQVSELTKQLEDQRRATDALRLDNALELKARDAGVQSPAEFKALAHAKLYGELSLTEDGTVSGLDEMIATMQEKAPHLFRPAGEQYKPPGGGPGRTQSTKPGAVLREQYVAARTAGNTREMLRIKTLADSQGINLKGE